MAIFITEDMVKRFELNLKSELLLTAQTKQPAQEVCDAIDEEIHGRTQLPKAWLAGKI